MRKRIHGVPSTEVIRIEAFHGMMEWTHQPAGGMLVGDLNFRNDAESSKVADEMSVNNDEKDKASQWEEWQRNGV